MSISERTIMAPKEHISTLQSDTDAADAESAMLIQNQTPGMSVILPDVRDQHRFSALLVVVI